MSIPKGPQDLTPQWLTQALRESGTIQEASVLSFTVDAIGQEEGITGQLARLTLAYDIQERDAPRTLVAKSPTPRTKGMHWRGREVLFYQQIADHIEMPTPHCHFAGFDETGHSVLLLEDLAPARGGDPITRDNLPKAELAICELAKLHAAWWDDPRLDEMDWLNRLDGAQVEEIMRPRWDPFLHRAGHRLPDKTVIESLRKHLAYVTDQLYEPPPRTFRHNDYQPNNLLFATPQGGVPFAVIDWGNVSHGRGTFDVAFYMCRGAPPQERRAIETGLLETYHTTLVENGVQGYALDQCIDDYRLSTLFVLARTGYIIAGNLSPTHQRRFVDTLLPRAYAAVTDLDAVELLSD